MPAKKDDKDQSLDEVISGLPDQIQTHVATAVEEATSDLPDQVKAQVETAVDQRLTDLKTDVKLQIDQELAKVAEKLEEGIEEKVRDVVQDLRGSVGEGEVWTGEAEQLPAIGESITYVIHELDTGHFREFAAQVTAVGSDGTTISLTYFAPNARAGRPVQLVEFGPGDGDEPRETYWRYPELTGNQVTDQA